MTASTVVTREQATIVCIEVGSPEMVRLAELRHSLLLELGRLNNPTLALRKLAEFKSDIASLGVEATVSKWSSWLKGARHNAKILPSLPRQTP